MCSAVLDPSAARALMLLGSLFGFQMKREKLPFDLGEQGNDSNLSLCVMLLPSEADDRERGRRSTKVDREAHTEGLK
jgi:hypothetical protein